MGEVGWRWDEEMRMIRVLHLLTLQFCSDIFKHLTEVKCVTGNNKWRRCCTKGTMNIKNVIRCPLKRFQSSKLWEIWWNWKGEMRKGNGFEVWWVRSPSGCGDDIWPAGGHVQPPCRGGIVDITTTNDVTTNDVTTTVDVTTNVLVDVTTT